MCGLSNFKKSFLCFFILFVTFVCSADEVQGGNFQGYWQFANGSSTLELRLVQHGQHLSGNFCSVMRSGARIDCFTTVGDKNIEGDIHGRTAILKAGGFYDRDAVGEIKLTLNHAEGMSWAFQSHSGEFFVPLHAELIQDKKTMLIVQTKTSIYSAPNKTNKTSAYFIEGDVAQVLEKLETGWIKIKYKNNKKIGWLAPAKN